MRRIHTYSLQRAAQPILNFFQEGVPGTDPDNLSIYFYVLCEQMCEIRMQDGAVLNCDTVGGAVDVGS